MWTRTVQIASEAMVTKSDSGRLLKSQPMKGKRMKYTWPDGSPRSQNNFFNWRSITPTVAPMFHRGAEARLREAMKRGAPVNLEPRYFHEYSRAVA